LDGRLDKRLQASRRYRRWRKLGSGLHCDGVQELLIQAEVSRDVLSLVCGL
jgi:hypothetical protein